MIYSQVKKHLLLKYGNEYRLWKKEQDKWMDELFMMGESNIV